MVGPVTGPATTGRLVVLVSGAGTNLQALIDAAADPAYGASVVAVGADRDAAGLAHAHERGGLVSAIYVVAYTAFSVPAVIGGIAVTSYGLRDTAEVYASTVVGLALVATVAYARQARRVPATA